MAPGGSAWFSGEAGDGAMARMEAITFSREVGATLAKSRGLEAVPLPPRMVSPGTDILVPSADPAPPARPLALGPAENRAALEDSGKAPSLPEGFSPTTAISTFP